MMSDSSHYERKHGARAALYVYTIEVCPVIKTKKSNYEDGEY